MFDRITNLIYGDGIFSVPEVVRSRIDGLIVSNLIFAAILFFNLIVVLLMNDNTLTLPGVRESILSFMLCGLNLWLLRRFHALYLCSVLFIASEIIILIATASMHGGYTIMMIIWWLIVSWTAVMFLNRHGFVLVVTIIAYLWSIYFIPADLLPLDMAFLFHFNTTLSPTEQFAFIFSFSLLIAGCTLGVSFYESTHGRERRTLLNSERKRSLYVQQTPTAFIECDATGRIVGWNPAAELIFGYAKAEAMGKVATDLLLPMDQQAEILPKWNDALQHRTSVGPNTLRSSTKAGPIIACDWYVTTLIEDRKEMREKDSNSEKDSLLGMIYIAVDVTERLKREWELQNAKDQAEAATQAKSEFLANMSHEIRTPMNGIIGMTSLLLDTPLDHEQYEFVETIHNSGDSLLKIINEILDFSKIEAGELTLETHSFDLYQCIGDVLDLFTHTAMSKQLDLDYQIDFNIPHQIWGDSTRLRQVMVNLLSNALKFTHEGGVWVMVDSKFIPDLNGDGHEYHEIHFAVKDTGIGIPKAKMDRLFQSFSQLDSSTTREYGGTGLGLAISRRLCEMMGGRMWVESELEEGSTFHFTIRVETVDEPTPVYLQKEQPLLSKRVVLVAEKDYTRRQKLVTYAKFWGMRPLEADSREAMMALLTQTESVGNSFLSMVLVGDTILDEEAMRTIPRIRAATHHGQSSFVLPFIVIRAAGNIQPSRQKKHLMDEIGAIQIVNRPVKPWGLHDALADLITAQSYTKSDVLSVEDSQQDRSSTNPLSLGTNLSDQTLTDVSNQATGTAFVETIAMSRPAMSDPTSTSPLSSSRNGSSKLSSRNGRKGGQDEGKTGERPKFAEQYPLSILLVEDNIVNQKVATRFLKRLGYAIDIANHGKEALEMVEQRLVSHPNDSPANLYDLVLMDVHMPELDGLEATQQIRQMQHLSRQPHIVGMTAAAMAQDRAQALEIGMNDYITKPIRFEELERVIKEMKMG
ncbi:MAG: ATP-binding protein [Chloroflexota bacterium]